MKKIIKIEEFEFEFITTVYKKVGIFRKASICTKTYDKRQMTEQEITTMRGLLISVASKGQRDG